MVVPRKIGRYEVLGQLATGGMAEILLARLSGPSKFARAVVIKRILRQYAQTEAFVTMFLDEARTIANIHHPNVVQVQELGEDAGEVFLVLEYVAGENLASILKRSVSLGERLDPVLVAHIVAEACAGLHAAHEIVGADGRHQNLVHRDVSPQNIFVAYDGHVKLLDFGVALTKERMTRTATGDIKGKLDYMSPEHVRGEPLDRRSDIFAMGIVLYELGTGRYLFQRHTPAQTVDAILKEPVLPPSRLMDAFPEALEAIIMKALSKAPEGRFATAAEMRRELLEVARQVSQPVEVVAQCMRRWFPERIAEKTEMLRRVNDGDEIGSVPPGDVDEDVRVPTVPDKRVTPVTSGILLSPGMPPRVARRRAAPIAIAMAGFVIVASAFAATKIMRRASPTAVASASASTIPSSPPRALESPPAPDAVLVHVESRPAGARVLADGMDLGKTPVDLRLARGANPVVLELQREGFAPTTQTIVPDADQKLLLSLQPAKGPRTTPRPVTPAGARGFRRFD